MKRRRDGNEVVEVVDRNLDNLLGVVGPEAGTGRVVDSRGRKKEGTDDAVVPRSAGNTETCWRRDDKKRRCWKLDVKVR